MDTHPGTNYINFHSLNAQKGGEQVRIPEYKLYINGRWVKARKGKTFQRHNPANPKEILGTFQAADKEDVRTAIDAAADAFPKWSAYPAPRRGEILLKAAQLLRDSKEVIATLLTKEMGKVIIEARGDVQEAIDVAEYMAGEGRRLFGHTTPSELTDKFCMTLRRPIGVVACITPWNFPMAIPAWKIMAALIAGNTIVFKPSSDTPGCAAKLVEIIEKAGLPAGVLNLITGQGAEIGDYLVTHKTIRGISFTGHRDTGKHIVEIAGLKRVGLELGSKNAIVVMPDADLNLAVDGILWGAFGTTGQRCTAASRIVAHKDIRKQLEKLLVDKTKKLKLGSGLLPKTDVGPLVNEAAQKKVHSYTEIGIKEGARLLCGGKKPAMQGYFYEPTIFTDATMKMRIMQEEIFGPTTCIIQAENMSEIVSIVNGVEYGLVSSIYTKNMADAFKAIEKFETGITYVNASTIGAEVHLPFGGVKQSGNGHREGGIEGIYEFTETKAVYIDYSGKLQKAQIDISRIK